MSTANYAPLLRRARTAYLGFPRDSEQRRMIEHIDGRLRAAPRDDFDASQQRGLAARLEDIIRPRTM